ncbi:MAG: hypothetical protein RLZZ283_774 [Candidatus Parcubacteria bacterium]|jgi:mannose-6-phosphate isomerase-like protein (cupin superfamily)
MLIKFSDTSKIETVEGTIWDYPISKDIGISYQNLKTRGPATGKYLNHECHEIYFVISGVATFKTTTESHEVGPHDVVVMEQNVAHHIETDGLEYITITRPDWYEGQYETVA